MIIDTPSKKRKVQNSVVITSIVLITVFLAWGCTKQGSFLQNNICCLLVSGVIGLFVGLSELLNRYKAFQYIFGNIYSWIYMLINFLAGLLAYTIIVKYKLDLGTIGANNIGKTLVAGLGAMAFLRSSFFNYKDSNGKTLEIGPAALLTVFLRASERQFDQLVAKKQLEHIRPIMKGLPFLKTSRDLPSIVLNSMVVLTDDELKKLNDDIAKLINDDTITSETKCIVLGILLARYCGILLLEEAVISLREIYSSTQNSVQIKDLSL